MPQSYQEHTSPFAIEYTVTFKYLSIDDVHALGFDGNSWTSLALDATNPRDATNKTIKLATVHKDTSVPCYSYHCYSGLPERLKVI